MVAKVVDMSKSPILEIRRGSPGGCCGYPAVPKTKKADVAEHPEVFHHVGLLTNEPLGTAELLFT